MSVQRAANNAELCITTKTEKKMFRHINCRYEALIRTRMSFLPLFFDAAALSLLQEDITAAAEDIPSNQSTNYDVSLLQPHTSLFSLVLCT